GLYWKRTTKAAVWVNIIFSTVFMILNMLVKSAFPTILQSPINAGAFCMLAGLIIVPVVSLLTKKPDKSQVEEVFSCYDKEVTVTSKHSIGE
ncbi:MAG: sodium:solute symporter, partial [Clostridia bacterium]|nr:sodium:solute symporter [Clostridia bacterium]